jgi:hypothetical protein
VFVQIEGDQAESAMCRIEEIIPIFQLVYLPEMEI